MVYYYSTEVEGTTYFIYMGKDKVENEDLISYGWSDDLWFHVDKLSSAHVYVRLPEGTIKSWKDLPEELIYQCCQLVKANSIEGNKKNNVSVVYTPWSNLKKTSDMAVGQVGFHNNREVKKFLVEKRENAVINAFKKTMDERYPDLRAEQTARQQRDVRRQKSREAAQPAREADEKAERERMKELQSYSSLMKDDKMSTNKDQTVSVEDYEDDFM